MKGRERQLSLTEDLSKLRVSKNLSVTENPSTPNGQRSSAMLRSSTTKSVNQPKPSENSTVASLFETKENGMDRGTTSGNEAFFSTTCGQLAGNLPGSYPTKARSSGSILQTVLDGSVTPALSTFQEIGTCQLQA